MITYRHPILPDGHFLHDNHYAFDFDLNLFHVCSQQTKVYNWTKYYIDNCYTEILWYNKINGHKWWHCCFVVKAPAQMMPSCRANNANWTTTILTCLYKIVCCATIHGRIWMNNIPNESRMVLNGTSLKTVLTPFWLSADDIKVVAKSTFVQWNPLFYKRIFPSKYESQIHRLLRARRALSIFKDVPLRTRRALSPSWDIVQR